MDQDYPKMELLYALYGTLFDWHSRPSAHHFVLFSSSAWTNWFFLLDPGDCALRSPFEINVKVFWKLPWECCFIYQVLDSKSQCFGCSGYYYRYMPMIDHYWNGQLHLRASYSSLHQRCFWSLFPLRLFLRFVYCMRIFLALVWCFIIDNVSQNLWFESYRLSETAEQLDLSWLWLKLQDLCYFSFESYGTSLAAWVPVAIYQNSPETSTSLLCWVILLQD